MMTFGRLDFSCNPKTQKLTTLNTESLVILITLYETYNPKIQHLSFKVDDVEGGASFGNRPANTTLRLLPFYLCWMINSSTRHASHLHAEVFGTSPTLSDCKVTSQAVVTQSMNWFVRTIWPCSSRAVRNTLWLRSTTTTIPFGWWILTKRRATVSPLLSIPPSPCRPVGPSRICYIIPIHIQIIKIHIIALMNGNAIQ